MSPCRPLNLADTEVTCRSASNSEASWAESPPLSFHDLDASRNSPLILGKLTPCHLQDQVCYWGDGPESNEGLRPEKSGRDVKRLQENGNFYTTVRNRQASELAGQYLC